MKRTRLFNSASLAVVLIILVAAGCKKSNDGSGGSGISATLGGTAWQSQYAAGVNFSGSTLLTGAYGKGSDTSMISINIPDSVKVNQADSFYLTTVSYIVKSTQKTYSGGWTAPYPSHGILLVTSWDKTAHKIAGTFSGVLYNNDFSNDSLKVDNGHFNTSYTAY